MRKGRCCRPHFQGVNPCLPPASLLGALTHPSSPLHTNVRIIRGDFSAVHIFLSTQAEVTENRPIFFNVFLGPPRASPIPAAFSRGEAAGGWDGLQEQQGSKVGIGSWRWEGWSREASCRLTVRRDSPSYSHGGEGGGERAAEETHVRGHCVPPWAVGSH